jgi:hypothetical protein
MSYARATAICLLTGAPLLWAAGPPAISFRFDRLNHDYQNLVAEVDPIESGPLTLRLSSPEHVLALKSNHVEIEPAGPESHRVRLSARFEGQGVLVAEADFAGIPATLEDRVVFPDQETEIEAQVRFDREESGYRITTERLPPHVEVTIESPLGKQLVAWCGRLAVFVAGDGGCGELDRRLSNPQLPLPPPGSEFFLPGDRLTDEERFRLDRYLAQQ